MSKVLCVCGKPIDKVPEWLAGVKVEFVCNNCPNRKTRNIAFVTLETTESAALDEEVPDDLTDGEDEDDGDASEL
ncbi:MAG: hypothetical protein SNJ74_03210 [Fimbriimonadaceae bacterium]